MNWSDSHLLSSPTRKVVELGRIGVEGGEKKVKCEGEKGERKVCEGSGGWEMLD